MPLLFGKSMLSYRHSYHAGNHADVLKHATQVLLLNKFKQKNKPFCYLDTHSGAGLYSLESEQAQKTAEYQGGIAKLWPLKQEFPELSDYFEVISHHNPNGQLLHYPGSPEIARYLLRQQDNMQLIELHNNEINELRNNLGFDNRVHIHHRNGFEGLVGLLPPTPARGFVLIDPSYELKTDYQAVIDGVQKALKRWPKAVIAVWYPILAEKRDYSEWLAYKLSQLSINNLLRAELSVEAQQLEFGMHGSGMMIINAPWQLDTQLESLVPKLLDVLDADGQGSSRVDWVVEGE
ncbi:23S rRNA (adenine(2030)-N(6))-methyltransferase RlmJ [Paraferrimonas sp. SM1919]|uniref:23S rRNA (adenine(2030)-N(6))-methyltransferase RlmJ n=1 Tax=Paraferrimonas sp. SM1919 TaxID=2662263 RepID=UPI001F08BDF3|nr:23S rRNA (adenine(2030)-N(6))-methyltransferase RlmJ [Paraferrimonas sp. SM1919]